MCEFTTCARVRDRKVAKCARLVEQSVIEIYDLLTASRVDKHLAHRLMRAIFFFSATSSRRIIPWHHRRRPCKRLTLSNCLTQRMCESISGRLPDSFDIFVESRYDLSVCNKWNLRYAWRAGANKISSLNNARNSAAMIRKYFREINSLTLE